MEIQQFRQQDIDILKEETLYQGFSIKKDSI